MYKAILEKYLINLYTIAPSDRPFCFSNEAADWFEATIYERDGESFDPINREAVSVWWEFNGDISQRRFVYKNLYTFLLVEGINVPYWEFINGEEYRCEERGMVYLKGGWCVTIGEYDLSLAF